MVRSLIHPPELQARPRIALLGKGFRPFFLAAALHAVLALPLFLLALADQLSTGAYLVPMYWHAHEMVFGFTAAVLGGFLLTAASNWTGRKTAEGWPLALLVLFWLLGRVGVFAADQLPRGLPALLDLTFLPALAIACARPIFTTRSRRNYGFIALLAGLWLCDVAIHGAALGLLAPELQRAGNWLAVDLITLVLVGMSGRVVPMFTRNALDADSVQGWPALERSALAALLASALLEALFAAPFVVGVARALAGVLVLLRMRRWQTARTLHTPLLWILHAGCIWIGIGLLLRGCGIGLPAFSAAGLHAITAGAIGALTLGMMTRVTLGHTGRMLVVPLHIAAAFAGIVLAAILRVLAPLLWPGMFAPLAVAGVLWCLAFLVYLVTYAPLLLSPRPDGRAG